MALAVAEALAEAGDLGMEAMNKRQAKKMRNKVVYPIVDEINLLTMSEEERDTAYRNFDVFVQKHFRYFHYKDKTTLIKKPSFYFFPVGSKVTEETRAYIAEMMRQVRTYRQMTEVTQLRPKEYQGKNNADNMSQNNIS